MTFENLERLSSKTSGFSGVNTLSQWANSITYNAATGQLEPIHGRTGDTHSD